MRNFMLMAVTAASATFMMSPLLQAGISSGGLTGGDRLHPTSSLHTRHHRMTYSAPVQYYARPTMSVPSGQTDRSFSFEPEAAPAPAVSSAAGTFVPAPTCCQPSPCCCGFSH